jgi:hypothetical protein
MKKFIYKRCTNADNRFWHSANVNTASLCLKLIFEITVMKATKAIIVIPNADNELKFVTDLLKNLPLVLLLL